MPPQCGSLKRILSGTCSVMQHILPWLLLLLLLLPPQGIEQSNLLQRLGPARLFNPAHPSCHWVLDLAHPGHEEVARKLVG